MFTTPFTSDFTNNVLMPLTLVPTFSWNVDFKTNELSDVFVRDSEFYLFINPFTSDFSTNGTDFYLY